jgi:hypothetical protein
MGEPVEQSAGAPFRADHAGPFGKRQRIEVLSGETNRRKFRDLSPCGQCRKRAIARLRSAAGTISHGSLAAAFHGMCDPIAWGISLASS